MQSDFTESIVEDAALAWLEGLGYAVAHGPDLAPKPPGAERADFKQVVLADRLRRAIVKLNSKVAAAALDEAFRTLTRPASLSLVHVNLSLFRSTAE